MKVYLTVCGLNWGKGGNVIEAQANLKKYGSPEYNGDCRIVYIFSTKNPDNVWIDDIGQIHYKKEDKLLSKTKYNLDYTNI